MKCNKNELCQRYIRAAKKLPPLACSSTWSLKSLPQFAFGRAALGGTKSLSAIGTCQIVTKKYRGKGAAYVGGQAREHNLARFAKEENVAHDVSRHYWLGQGEHTSVLAYSWINEGCNVLIDALVDEN